MRISAVLFVILSLAACNRAPKGDDAVRQGVLDHLTESQAKTNLNLAGMDVVIKSVQYKGNEADAEVSITPKGGNPAAGMSINYHLQQQGSKWVVVGRQDPHGAVASPGADPHGGGAMPGGADPHGGGMAAPGGGGSKMPAPDDLPPTDKKK